MNREIKFRAWQTNVGDYNKETKEFTPRPTYFYGRDVILDGNGQLLSVESGWDIQGVEEPKNYTLEQYTGLKDKNGKEIYEGDIIKFADLELAMKPVGIVCFADGKFFIKDWEFDDGSYHIVDFYDYNIPHKDFEIIGNIHENPELLGGKNE